MLQEPHVSLAPDGNTSSLDDRDAVNETGHARWLRRRRSAFSLGPLLVVATGVTLLALLTLPASDPVQRRVHLAADDGPPSSPTNPQVSDEEECLRVANDCTDTERQFARARAAAPATTMATGPPRRAQPLTRETAIDRATRLTAIVTRVDRVTTKLTTWSTWKTAQEAALLGGTTVDPVAPHAKVWLVAVEGAITPPTLIALHFDWAIFVYDAATGTGLGMSANDGTLPSHFQSLIDEDPT